MLLFTSCPGNSTSVGVGAWGGGCWLPRGLIAKPRKRPHTPQSLVIWCPWTWQEEKLQKVTTPLVGQPGFGLYYSIVYQVPVHVLVSVHQYCVPSTGPGTGRDKVVSVLKGLSVQV